MQPLVFHGVGTVDICCVRLLEDEAKVSAMARAATGERTNGWSLSDNRTRWESSRAIARRPGARGRDPSRTDRFPRRRPLRCRIMRTESIPCPICSISFSCRCSSSVYGACFCLPRAALGARDSAPEASFIANHSARGGFSDEKPTSRESVHSNRARLIARLACTFPTPCTHPCSPNVHKPRIGTPGSFAFKCRRSASSSASPTAPAHPAQ